MAETGAGYGAADLQTDEGAADDVRHQTHVRHKVHFGRLPSSYEQEWYEDAILEPQLLGASTHNEALAVVPTEYEPGEGVPKETVPHPLRPPSSIFGDSALVPSLTGGTYITQRGSLTTELTEACLRLRERVALVSLSSMALARLSGHSASVGMEELSRRDVHNVFVGEGITNIVLELGIDFEALVDGVYTPMYLSDHEWTVHGRYIIFNPDYGTGESRIVDVLQYDDTISASFYEYIGPTKHDVDANKLRSHMPAPAVSAAVGAGRVELGVTGMYDARAVQVTGGGQTYQVTGMHGAAAHSFVIDTGRLSVKGLDSVDVTYSNSIGSVSAPVTVSTAIAPGVERSTVLCVPVECTHVNGHVYEVRVHGVGQYRHSLVDVQYNEYTTFALHTLHVLFVDPMSGVINVHDLNKRAHHGGSFIAVKPGDVVQFYSSPTSRVASPIPLAILCANASTNEGLHIEAAAATGQGAVLASHDDAQGLDHDRSYITIRKDAGDFTMVNGGAALTGTEIAAMGLTFTTSTTYLAISAV